MFIFEFLDHFLEDKNVKDFKLTKFLMTCFLFFPEDHTIKESLSKLIIFYIEKTEDYSSLTTSIVKSIRKNLKNLNYLGNLTN